MNTENSTTLGRCAYPVGVILAIVAVFVLVSFMSKYGAKPDHRSPNPNTPDFMASATLQPGAVSDRLRIVFELDKGDDARQLQGFLDRNHLAVVSMIGTVDQMDFGAVDALVTKGGSSHPVAGLVHTFDQVPAGAVVTSIPYWKGAVQYLYVKADR